MKLYWLYCALVINTLVCASTASAKGSGVAVVELFTSEGCSSCPPAEAALSRLQDKYGSQLFLLAFHVDYWNHLGWKDKFSQKAFTERQNQYGALFGLNSTYTPQAIVSGTFETVGSYEEKIAQKIDQELLRQTSNELAITAKSGVGEIEVAYKALKNDDVLHLALVMNSADVDVWSGENGGRRLKHLNVVIDFKSVERVATNGTVRFSVPSEKEQKYAIIAYTQNRAKMQVTAAVRCDIL